MLRHAFAGALALALSAFVGLLPAKATDANTCGYVQGPGGWYKLADRSGPYVLDSNCNATLIGTAGVITAAPYAYTPLSPGQHNLANVTATPLTAPTGSTYAIVCAGAANEKYTTDGTTTPTSSVGMTLTAGACVTLSGPAVIASFKAISATGTLDVEFFR